MPAAAPSKARITAAIEAAQATGIRIAELRIERDGTLRILAEPENRRVGSRAEVVDCDELFAGKRRA